MAVFELLNRWSDGPKFSDLGLTHERLDLIKIDPTLLLAAAAAPAPIMMIIFPAESLSKKYNKPVFGDQNQNAPRQIVSPFC